MISQSLVNILHIDRDHFNQCVVSLTIQFCFICIYTQKRTMLFICKPNKITNTCLSFVSNLVSQDLQKKNL